MDSTEAKMNQACNHIRDARRLLNEAISECKAAGQPLPVIARDIEYTLRQVLQRFDLWKQPAAEVAE